MKFIERNKYLVHRENHMDFMKAQVAEKNQAEKSVLRGLFLREVTASSSSFFCSDPNRNG